MSIIDIHTHILPKMDDGSKSVEESMKMIELEKAQNVNKIVFTPHFYASDESPDMFLSRRKKAYDELKDKICVNDFNFVLGAEVYYFATMGNCDELKKLTISDTKYILIEMPYGQWNDNIIDDVLNIQNKLKLKVILAHAERFLRYKKSRKYIENLVDNGCLIQINLDSFTSFSIKRILYQWIKKDMVFAIASDCHNMTTRPAKWNEVYPAIIKKIGINVFNQINKKAEVLFQENI